METAAFFHVYCSGGWTEALTDFLAARREAALDCPTFAGLVGPEEARGEARLLLSEQAVDVVIEADTGWEQVTLKVVQEHCQRAPDFAVFYGHTKGASTPPSEWSALWRRSMILHTVTLWRDCLAALENGADAAGCNYLPDQGGGPPSHFQGNFWWARAAFVASLPPLDYANRHEAEFWMGRSDAPRTVLDLCPGGYDPAVDHDSGPCEHRREVIHDKHTVTVG